jgi:hypothetical protein
MAVDITRGDIQAAAEGQREMGEVTADADAPLNASNAVLVERACK